VNLARQRWLALSRPNQWTPDGTWYVWLILAGRGWGKTRTGAEDMAHYAMTHDDSRIGIVAPTAAAVRDVCVEGESGLLGIIPAPLVRTWNRSLGEMVLTNGSSFKLFSADEPDRLRGYQFHRAWCDELAAWRYPDAWDQLLFGLRLGDHPRVVITTTPRPVLLVRQLLQRDGVVVTRGSTFENAANLAPAALAQLRERYAGTRIGRQELEAEILDDVPGALWQRDRIDELRTKVHPDLARVVVAIDPSGGSDEGHDEQGIIVAGKGVDGHAYILDDASCRMSPDGWGRRAVNAYHMRNADRIVAEANFGGQMVAHVVKTVDPLVAYKEVHASRGKRTRAEPVAALYEQGRVHHVGSFPELEDQLCTWTPDSFDGSPDRLDALVWALTELMLGSVGVWFA